MRKRNSRRYKKVYLILVDGKNEIWYFLMLKKNENIREINIKPELPKKRSLTKMFDDAKSESKHYDKVILLIDLDKIISDNKK